MRDEDDRRAFGRESLQRPEQRARLSGRQHGTRLVQHEPAGATQQHLEDLEALALAHRQILDASVGAQLELKARADLFETPSRGREVQTASARRLVAQDRVLQHGERAHLHEVLVHHAQPRARRSPRADRHDERRAVGAPSCRRPVAPGRTGRA
jgi:hypothetical protein